MMRLPTLLVCASLASACGAEGDGGVQRHRPQTFDTKKIDLDDFATDAALQRRVVHMPFGEIAARLGSARFSAKSTFVFERGAQSHEQEDTYLVAQDSNGHFEVELTTPQNSVRVVYVDDALYVRQDAGRMRRNERPELTADTWTDLAWTSLAETLDLFRPQLLFGEAKQSTREGREILVYAISVGTEVRAERELAHVPNTRLPLAPPPQWREKARPVALSGKLTLDAATGAVLALELEGELDLADREIKPTRLRVSYSGALSQLGKVATIVAPKGAVPAYRKELRPRDPLSFFRHELPPPPPAQ